jgi:hypothetical protein
MQDQDAGTHVDSGYRFDVDGLISYDLWRRHVYSSSVWKWPQTSTGFLDLREPTMYDNSFTLEAT